MSNLYGQLRDAEDHLLDPPAEREPRGHCRSDDCGEVDQLCVCECVDCEVENE